MAQHDYNIANASGASVRSDLNVLFSAIVTWNSGTAPATTFARMRWVDTSTGTVKRRNAANSAWIIESTDDESRVLSRSSNTILDVSDIGKAFVATAAFTQTLDAAATLGDGWMCYYRVNSGVSVTIDPSGSENIDGATTKVVSGPSAGVIFCNGSAFFTYGFAADSQPTRQVFLSGSGTYTTPAGAKRIQIRMIGAGGGGGGCGTGGQSAGTAGGNTTFSTFTAGGGGATNNVGGIGTGGVGGAATGSPDIGIAGGNGGTVGTVGAPSPGGSGGTSVFGGHGTNGASSSGGGGSARANTGSGGGGAGGNTSVAPAGGGGAGAYVEHRIVSPAASYSYSVGAAGGAGGAGGSGAAGGAGGSGIIIVDEFYD